jgi:hypothetical protein
VLLPVLDLLFLGGFVSVLETVVTFDLIVEMIFFPIELLLLRGSNVAAVHASISLLLSANGPVFSFELAIVTAKISSFTVDLAIYIVVASQYFGSTRMILAEVAGEAGQNGGGKHQAES